MNRVPAPAEFERQTPDNFRPPPPDRDSQHVRACPRIKVAKVWDRIPGHWIRQLEQNQLISTCCRHPEDHEIEAFYTTLNWKKNLDPMGDPIKPDQPQGGVPDVYIFHCTCGRKHRRFLVGFGLPGPMWGWRNKIRELWHAIGRL
jgi:hypothetical protein